MYFKYTLNFKLKLSVVSLKSFVVHCVTSGVRMRIGKTVQNIGFRKQYGSCSHLSPPFPEFTWEFVDVLRTDGIILCHVMQRHCSLRTKTTSGIKAGYTSPLSALWHCACFHSSMCIFPLEHVYIFIIAYAHFQLSMYTLPVELVQACSCACAFF